MTSQHEYDIKQRLIRLAEKALFYGMLTAIAFFLCKYGYLAVKELAGRQTTADLLLSALIKLEAPRPLALALAYFLAAGSSTWGYLERKSKKKVIARLHPKARLGQALLDKNKGSSKITLQGDTGPEDQ